MTFPPPSQPAEEAALLPIPSEAEPQTATTDLLVENIFVPPVSDDDSGDGVDEQAVSPTIAAEPDAEEPERKPFVIELLRLDVAPNGYFRPDSAVQITRSLRTSGLLSALPPEEVKTLLWMLTFTTTNGDCLPSVTEMVPAMGVSESQARERLDRLVQFHWQGQPLALALPAESGLDRYAPSPHIVAFIERPPTLAYSPTALQPVAAGREAILAYSRAHYGRPRAEVEALIAQQMGWEEEEAPEDPEERAVWEVKQVLKTMGVTKEQAQHLFARYPLERIQRQMEWLPYRHAKNPLGYLLAAIEGDYERPLALRQQTSPTPSPPSAQSDKEQGVNSS
jgi:hypothetical protein